jgi:hypothetical protein
VAQAIVSWYPALNRSPTPTTANPFNNNYVGLAPSINDNKSYIVKLDQNVGKNDTFDLTGKLWKFYGQNNNALKCREALPGPLQCRCSRQKV